MVRGNGGWKQTLLEICITTPRGGQRRWMGKRGQGGAECREGGGTHIDPGNHPAPRAPSSSLRATATRPPPCSRSSIHFSLPPSRYPATPSCRPLFHGQLSACLQCPLCRVFMSSLALKPPASLKFDALRMREARPISSFSSTN